MYYVAKAIRRELKGQGDTLHIYDHQLLHHVSIREKMLRDTEYAKHSNFFCQPVCNVIYTNCWCNFSVTAEIHRTEPILTAGSLSCFPHTWLLPCACWLPGTWGFNVTWVLSNREGQR